MKLETIDDVLGWTQEFHRHLSQCLERCRDSQHSERARLLMSYLVDHEKQLQRIVGKFRHQADPKALNTWCIEYFDKRPVKDHDVYERPYGEMDAEEIMAAVVDQHEEVIDLYHYLIGRANTEEVKELLEELLQMEQHEAMRMVQGSNRLTDI